MKNAIQRGFMLIELMIVAVIFYRLKRRFKDFLKFRHISCVKELGTKPISSTL